MRIEQQHHHSKSRGSYMPVLCTCLRDCALSAVRGCVYLIAFLNVLLISYSGVSDMRVFAQSPAVSQLPSSQSAPSSQPALASPSAVPASSVPQAVSSTVQPAFRAILDPIRSDLERIENALKRPDVSEGEMERFRERVKPITDTLREFLNDEQPKIDAARARLEQLGPKPDDKSPPESPELASERAQRDKDLKDVLEGQKLGNALLVQAEQISTTLSERKRTAFRKVLFEQHTSLVMPELWLGVLSNLSQDMSAIRQIQNDWMSSLFERLSDRRGLILLLAVALAVTMTFLRRYLQTKVVLRDPAKLNPSREKIALAAIAHVILHTVPIALGCYFIFMGLQITGLISPRVSPMIIALLGTIVFTAFVRSLSEALLAPDIPHWRYIAVQDRAAGLLQGLSVSLALLVGFNKVGEALLQETAASAPLSIAWRGVFAVVFAITCMGVLRRLKNAMSPDGMSPEDAACLGPYVAPSGVAFSGSLRLVAWLAVIAILISAFAGYVILAEFLMDQLVWITLIGVVLLFGLNLCQDLIANVMSGDSRMSLALQANMGVRKRSIQQIGVLLTGVSRLTLIFIAVLLVLAPWGVETDSLWSSVKAAFFGFKVGDVTISLSAVLMAIVFFALGLAGTRAVQRWLDQTYLPSTDLDAGLRNSIKTAFGYVGVLIAVMLGFAQLGVSLDKLTIVAGALSVGIGFGLQSIVSNFVSGLILLWERPIRVDDLVVAGDVEGYVKRINVRSTEFETFDKATVIVPNSNLISGVVKNRMRNSMLGRIIVPLSVPRSTDPEQMKTLLLGVAAQHADVIDEPSPRVLFKKIGDAMLDFELICFIANVDTAARISSELHFAIFARLQAQGLEAPALPASNMNLIGLDRLENTLEHIAEAIEHEQEEMTLEEKSAFRKRLREAKKRENEQIELKQDTLKNANSSATSPEDKKS